MFADFTTLALLVPTPGIEPGSTILQTAAMTTFAKLALVLSTRIELVIHPYQGCVIPLNYESMVPCEGIEPPSDPCKGPALPLDEQGKNLGCLMRIELILPRSQHGVQTTTL